MKRALIYRTVHLKKEGKVEGKGKKGDREEVRENRAERQRIVTTATMVPLVEGKLRQRHDAGKKAGSRQRIRRSDELSNQRSLKQRVEQSRDEWR